MTGPTAIVPAPVPAPPVPPARGPAAPGPAVARTTFGGLTIEHGCDVLAPRAWTLLQSEWACELADVVPPGPVLELCAGVGHIGLVVARRTGRPLVQVDVHEDACALARANAARAGLAGSVEVRHQCLSQAVGAGERYPLVLADPPYVPSGEVDRFPEDPPGAIDGGRDGLDLARCCIDVVDRALPAGGVALLQLRDAEQARALAAGFPPDLRLHDVRTDGPDRAVALVRR